MPVSTFFNNYRSHSEQSLIEDLIVESIKQYGIDVLYLPSAGVAPDHLYGENFLKQYNGNYPIEMYIRNVDKFGGDGEFFSKFGLKISDTMTLTMSTRVFMRNVGTPLQISRPREGDLIWFPLNRKIFEIKFVEHEPVFYQMGALQMFDIKCELFEYKNHIFNTGIAEIDNRYKSITTDVNVNTVVTDDETGADNDIIQTTANTFMDFSESNPFSEGNY